MRQPRVSSVIERRLLVNYRVAPAAVASMLPVAMRPQQIDGWAVAGICLIRLGRVRPAWLPGALGLRSENAAHRIAVEWDGPDGPEKGVYIARRDTGSTVSVLASGRLAVVHHAASFDVRETSRDLHIAYASRDGATQVSVDADVAERFQGSTLFASLGEASDFFRRGSAGYSAGRDASCLDGVELDVAAWRVEPVEVRHVRSTFFDDPDRFPPGSAVLDNALLMRAVPAIWKPLRPMPVRDEPAASAGAGQVPCASAAGSGGPGGATGTAS
ncbi:DUF2071 domain-containing protein [Pseudofrankia asymbiotica]|uniref:DUF2071 domain-containing protein n=1 Tax=Pseudofrankia asymbiotica TaxID=1834516 RepID=A0A1V2I7X4_9ACTN|nr:DUF2071 domain-containing protein [Pseudofrankia asymbiotica]ONH26587.1 hypothetical protein BL253_24370 [Pseudofrankia asymbiotica]